MRRLCDWFSGSQTTSSKSGPEFFFDYLGPVDELSADSSYIYALSYALKEEPILNIALSGPYGSGKSSIIKSYQKIYKEEFINVSLATFEHDEIDEQNKKSDRYNYDGNKIEESIVKQILYNKSYIDIDRSPIDKFSIFNGFYKKSILIIIFLISSYFCFKDYYGLSFSQIRDRGLTSPSVFSPIFLVLFLLGASLGLRWLLAASSKFSLKDISFSSAGLEVGAAAKESFLSAHLDEIIYFFQATDKKVVVFEDLDRFKKPEVFHKLREINKIVNENQKGNKVVKFIYAISDSIFKESDRTKFFDFIIPVIPISDANNSYFKIRDELERRNINFGLDERFIQDTSYYLYDFRIIKNIVNEFEMYVSILNGHGLDRTRLFAVLVYKNVYSDDFEKLHNHDGILHKICTSRDELERRRNQQLDQRSKDVLVSIEESNAEKVRSLDDLVSIYLLAILLDSNLRDKSIRSFQVAGTDYNLEQIANPEAFRALVDVNKFVVIAGPPPGYGRNDAYRFEFKAIERSVDERRPFLSRWEAIENQSSEGKLALQTEHRELIKLRDQTRKLSFSELIAKDIEYFDKLIFAATNDIDQSKFLLLRSLLLSGYLDENYSDYTSEIRVGWLGKNDITYRRLVRAGKVPYVDLELENPDKVCEFLSDTDFGKASVLNISLIDYLFDPTTDASQQQSITLEYLAANFETSDEFLVLYYEAGKNHHILVSLLAEKWSEVSASLLASPNSFHHMAALIRYASADMIASEMNGKREFTSFVEEYGAELQQGLLFELRVHFPLYAELGVRFPKLRDFLDCRELLHFAASNCLYTFTPDNISIAYSIRLGDPLKRELELERANYTTIINASDEHLKQYVEKNLQLYVKNVLIELPDNRHESDEAILKVLNSGDVSDKDIKAFVSRQEHVFENFKSIPNEWMTFFLATHKVRIGWAVIAEYLASDEFEPETLLGVIQENDSIAILKKQNIGDLDLSETAYKRLVKFVWLNNDVDDEAYVQLAPGLPEKYDEFPEGLSRDKFIALARSGKIALSASSFETADGDDELLAELILENEATFSSSIDEFPVSPEVVSLLWKGSLGADTRVMLVGRMDAAEFKNRQDLMQSVAKFIVDSEIDVSWMDIELIRLCVSSCRDLGTNVELILRVSATGRIVEIPGLLRRLEGRYRRLGESRKQPTIPKNDIGLKLVRELERVNLVSKYIEEKDAIHVYNRRFDD